MARSARAKSRRRPHPHAIQRPNGVIHPRVQDVGPEHFGILSVDCAKARCKIMLADFYGQFSSRPPSSSIIRPVLGTPSASPRGLGPALHQGPHRCRRSHRPLPRTHPARLRQGRL